MVLIDKLIKTSIFLLWGAIRKVTNYEQIVLVHFQ